MTDNSGNGNSDTPPGFYPDNQGTMRWWDGAAWTEQVQQGGPPAATSQAPLSGTSDPKRAWYAKKRWWAVAAVFVIIAVAAASGGGDDPGDDAPSAASGSTTPSTEKTDKTEPKADLPEAEEVVESETTKPEPHLTKSQENAVDSAQGYLDFSGFSRRA